MEPFFQGLRPFVWPKYREEGPPAFVQGILQGQDFLSQESDLSSVSKSILELMIVGYRPATTLAILKLLLESPHVSMHGMQIARELEKRFEVQDGWFTKTRYYSDRVGKVLTLLSQLEMIQEVQKKDSRSGRTLTTYLISPSTKDSVKEQVATLARGERMSVFKITTPDTKTPQSVIVPQNPRECIGCGARVDSAIASYCERCGKPLRLTCEKCGAKVEALYDYCLTCGSRIK